MLPIGVDVVDLANDAVYILDHFPVLNFPVPVTIPMRVGVCWNVDVGLRQGSGEVFVREWNWIAVPTEAEKIRSVPRFVCAAGV